MKKYFYFMLLLLCSCVNQHNVSKKLSNIMWESDPYMALKKADESNKLVLLYFYDNSCDWCVLFEKNFDDNNTRVALNKEFILVKEDVTSSDLAAMIGIKTVPTVLIVDKNSKLLAAGEGYLDNKQFQKFLKNRSLGSL